MALPTFETIASFLTIIFAVLGALLAGFWLSMIIWVFRDMRLRSRDPFAQILAAVLAALPIAGPFLYLILRPPETLAERYERALEEEALLQEIEERPRCHSCSRSVEDDWVVCPTCFVELKKQCVGCTSLLERGWKVCPHCATEQPEQMRPLNKKMLRQQIKTRGQVVVHTPPALPAHASNGSGNGKTDTHAPRVRRRYRSVTVGRNGKGTAEPLPGDYVIGEANNPTVVSFAPTADELERLERQMASLPDSFDKSSTIVPVPNVSANEVTVVGTPGVNGQNGSNGHVEEGEIVEDSAEVTVIANRLNIKRGNGVPGTD